ncbi:MAG: glutamine synthetase family protein [Moorellales bacterium]
MQCSDEVEVLEKAREYNVKFVRLQFTDIFGALKNVAITVEDLPRVLNEGMLFDASVVEGLIPHRQTDMVLRPDPRSFVVFPWRPREGAVARLLCDLYTPAGEPFPSCSRSVLRKVREEARSKGWELMVASEAEFFLFQLDDRGQPTTLTHDLASYCDLTPIDLGENARRDMVLTLQEMGFDIASSHHELGPGQHEIALKPADALQAADQLVTFKFVVRTIAQRHGLHASFMPKPLSGVNGSGLCLQLQVWQGDRNCLWDPQGEWGLSRAGRGFIGGILRHARGTCALTNPLVNSYKRLIPSDTAPTFVAWAEESRNAIIRLPAGRGAGTRIEVRHPDPTCNPYLALAVLFRAGLAGVSQGLEPSPPVPENLYRSKGGGHREPRGACLPRTLEQALEAMREDDLVRETLGETLFDLYYRAKLREWERFIAEVHPWELEEYLKAY